jgi:hypothetical protein
MEENPTPKPAVSPEEFAELRNMQAQQTLLQSQGYQAYNFLKQIDAQFEEISRNYTAQKAQVQEQLEKVESELLVANSTFQQRFKDIIAEHGFDGAVAVNIEETEPHYITEATTNYTPPVDDYIPSESAM